MKKTYFIILALILAITFVSCGGGSGDGDKEVLLASASFDASKGLNSYAIVDANSDISVSNIADEKSFFALFTPIVERGADFDVTSRGTTETKGQHGFVSNDAYTLSQIGIQLISAASNEFKSNGADMKVGSDSKEVRIKEIKSNKKGGIDFYTDAYKIAQVENKKDGQKGWLYANQVYFDLSKGNLDKNELIMIVANSGSSRWFNYPGEMIVSGDDVLLLDQKNLQGRFAVDVNTDYLHSIHLVAGRPTEQSANTGSYGMTYLFLKTPVHFNGSNTISLKDTVNVICVDKNEISDYDQSKEYVLEFSYPTNTNIEGLNLSSSALCFGFGSSGSADARYYTTATDMNGKKRFEAVMIGGSKTGATLYLGSLNNDNYPFTVDEYIKLRNAEISNDRIENGWGTVTIRPLDQNVKDKQLKKFKLSDIKNSPTDLEFNNNPDDPVYFPVIFDDDISGAKTIKIEFLDGEGKPVEFFSVFDNMANVYLFADGGQRTSKNAIRPTTATATDLHYTGNKIESLIVTGSPNEQSKTNFNNAVKKIRITVSVTE